MPCAKCKREFGSVVDGKVVNAQPIYICPEATVSLICTDCCETLEPSEILNIGYEWFKRTQSDESFGARRATAEGKCYFAWDVEYIKGLRDTRPFIPTRMVSD